MNEFEVSFIVPLFNQLEASKAMLASLLATIPSGLAHEIILVDDASTDGTRQWLAGLTSPNLRVLLNATNSGFARTVNVGATQASGNVLALLNNDLLLLPGWLEPMLAAIRNPALNAGIVGNVQTRVIDDSLDHVGVQILTTGKLEHIQLLPTSSVEYARVFAVTGACCMLRREVFNAVGGFEEAFLNGGEDIDLCQKVKSKGLHIVMAYRSVVRHHVSLSRGRVSQQNEVNSRLLQSKWRREFKTELAGVWLSQLRDLGQASPQGLLDGRFTPSLLATPHLLARVVAESMLQQEECRWIRTLEGLDINPNLAAHCQVRGLYFSSVQGGYVLDNAAGMYVTGLRSVRNFFIHGRVLGGPVAKDITLTIEVNGIQEKFAQLQTGANINMGIIAPVCLPEITNCFVITTTAPLLVSHFVLDDQVVVG